MKESSNPRVEVQRVEVQPHTEAGDKRVPGKQVFKPHVHVTTRDEVTQTEEQKRNYRLKEESVGFVVMVTTGRVSVWS
jgi:hypothetical protein